jgi:hypothetical protein
VKLDSFDALADRIAARVVSIPAALQNGLDAAGEIVKTEAQARIGKYHEAAGEFLAWAPLADATQAARVRQGFEANEPLLRTGDLRDAIEVRPVPEGVRVGVLGGEMGPIAFAQEYGCMTHNGGIIPPRSFIRATAYLVAEKITGIIGARFGRALKGEADE